MLIGLSRFPLLLSIHCGFVPLRGAVYSRHHVAHGRGDDNHGDENEQRPRERHDDSHDSYGQEKHEEDYEQVGDADKDDGDLSKLKRSRATNAQNELASQKKTEVSRYKFWLFCKGSCQFLS